MALWSPPWDPFFRKIIFPKLKSKLQRACRQCDQMAKLAVQHLAIYTDENLPNSKKCQISLKILPITKLTLQKMP